uniref:Uncharacterized protein n=1 Tax=Vitis vinifera TaxID=29760 RepID=F6HPT6_VITVI
MASPDPPTTAATPAATTATTSTTTATTAMTTATIRSFSTLPPPAAPLTVDPMAIVRYPVGQPPHPLPYSTIRVPNPQLAKPHDPPQGILYPVASSGRGFIPKPLRPQSSDHNTVTVANPGAAFPPRSAATAAAAFSHQARPFGFPQSDLNYPVHSMRMPHLLPSHVGVTAVPGSAPIKGIPVSAHPKVQILR